MRIKRGALAGIMAAVVSIATLIPAQGAEAVTYKSASAVRSLKSADAWLSTSPRTPRIKLSWVKPAYTYSATIVGYAIQSKLTGVDSATWKTLVSNTKSTATSAIVSSGLTLGVNQTFRVRAITKRYSKTLWGAYSDTSTRKPTGKPSNPILLGDNSVVPGSSGTYTAVWAPQSASQTGGLQVTYTATASLNGASVSSCQLVTRVEAEDAANRLRSCEIPALSTNQAYKISLAVKNYRGLGSNTDQSIPADSLFGLQWYLGESNGVSATRAWTATKGSTSVVVAVLDSGITKHADLDGQVVSGYDFVANRDTAPSGDGDGWDSDATDTGNPLEDPNNQEDNAQWHGTHVAGIIAARQDSAGIVGLAPRVKIQPVRVIGPNGGNLCDLSYAIRWAAGVSYEALPGCDSFSGVPVNKTPARVINISLEANGYCPSILQNAINAAQDRGAILVAAAGNSAVANSTVSPTSCQGPISVGATDYSGDKTSYTNYDVDISAPGGTYQTFAGAPSLASYGSYNGTILSTWNTGQAGPVAGTYLGVSGTSMAAPVVSGIVALMVSIRPKATYAQIASALIESARPFEQGTDCSVLGNCGSGIANAAEALRYLVFDIG